MKTHVRMKYLRSEDYRQIGGLGEVIMDRVEEALAVKGMTHKKFGERAGITNPGYAASWWGGVRRQIERGTFNPSMGHVLRFARALKVEPLTLMEPFK